MSLSTRDQDRRQIMLGMSSQQLVSNSSQSRQQAGGKGVSAHAAGWPILLQTGQDYVEQVRGVEIFRRFAGGNRMVQQFPGAEITVTRTMVPAHPESPGCGSGPAREFSC